MKKHQLTVAERKLIQDLRAIRHRFHRLKLIGTALTIDMAIQNAEYEARTFPPNKRNLK